MNYTEWRIEASMRPSDITDGIMAGSEGDNAGAAASMRPSDITDGILGIVGQLQWMLAASMRPSDITDGIKFNTAPVVHTPSWLQ